MIPTLNGHHREFTDPFGIRQEMYEVYQADRNASAYLAALYTSY